MGGDERGEGAHFRLLLLFPGGFRNRVSKNFFSQGLSESVFFALLSVLLKSEAAVEEEEEEVGGPGYCSYGFCMESDSVSRAKCASQEKKVD